MTSSSADAGHGHRPPGPDSDAQHAQQPGNGDAQHPPAESSASQDATAAVVATADLDAAASAASNAIANLDAPDGQQTSDSSNPQPAATTPTAAPESGSMSTSAQSQPGASATAAAPVAASSQPASADGSTGRATEADNHTAQPVQDAQQGEMSAPASSTVATESAADPSQPAPADSTMTPNNPSTPKGKQGDQAAVNFGQDFRQPGGLKMNIPLDAHNSFSGQNNPSFMAQNIISSPWPHQKMDAFSVPATPTTVTPSQVQLNHTLPIDDHASTIPQMKEPQNPGRQHLESFARIEFADSVFQVNTYTVVIGRDRGAIKQAQQNEREQEVYEKQVEENAKQGLPPPLPPQPNRAGFSKSYVSEEGGMLGPESSNEDEDSQPPAAKRRKVSSAGSPAKEEEEADKEDGEAQTGYDRQYVSHTPGAAVVDTESLRPSPNYTAFVGIHSPGPNIAKKSKGISRRHLQIDYNTKTGQWEAAPLHNNGFFHGEEHKGPGERIVLKCGDHLQIKDVSFRFHINGVKPGKTGAEEGKKAGGGKGMSFDFEANGNGRTQDTSDELSDVDEAEVDDVDISQLDKRAKVKTQEDEDQPMQDAPEYPKPESTERVPVPLNQPSLDPSLMMPEIPKKRGPGRPPKNGIMSKRQQRELKKAQQELARQQAAQEPPTEPPAKRKVGRPRKHPLPEGETSPEKRKYKPRQPKADGEVSDPERPVKEKKSKVPRPKSPPLSLQKEDYTEQQLQKPNKNYGMLIDETLSAAPDGLTLKQIYKRIATQYPWFYFCTETKGWESSVRHNLIGNEAFKKEEATNLWKRVPGVELDAGKRRKATSPDRNLAAQAYNAQHYQYNQAQQQHMGQPHAVYAQGQQVPPGYQMPNYNAQQQPGQPRPMQPQPGQAGSPPNPHIAPTAAGQQPAYIQQHPPPAAAQQGGPPQYNSPSYPYQQMQAHPPVKPEHGAATAHPPQQMNNQAQHPPVAPARTTPTGGVARPPQAQQPPQQPNRTTPHAPPAATPSQDLIDPALKARIKTLKVSLANGLKEAKTPHAEDIVWSSLDRIVGLKSEPAGYNNTLELTCFNGFNNMIRRSRDQDVGTPATDANGGTPETCLYPPEVTKHIRGLRDQCVAAIKSKLPGNDAASLVHSAILRILGLATETRFSGGLVTKYGNLEDAVMQNLSGVISQVSGKGQRRGSSAGPRPSPAASQSRPSATPQPPTPTAASASVASAPAPQAPPAAVKPQHASPPMPVAAAPQAPAQAPAQPPAQVQAQAPAPAAAAPQAAGNAPKPQPTAQPAASPQIPQPAGAQQSPPQPVVPSPQTAPAPAPQTAAVPSPQAAAASVPQAAAKTPAAPQPPQTSSQQQPNPTPPPQSQPQPQAQPQPVDGGSGS